MTRTTYLLRAAFDRRRGFDPGRAGADIKIAIEQLRSR